MFPVIFSVLWTDEKNIVKVTLKINIFTVISWRWTTKCAKATHCCLGLHKAFFMWQLNLNLCDNTLKAMAF